MNKFAKFTVYLRYNKLYVVKFSKRQHSIYGRFEFLQEIVAIVAIR